MNPPCKLYIITILYLLIIKNTLLYKSIKTADNVAHLTDYKMKSKGLNFF